MNTVLHSTEAAPYAAATARHAPAEGSSSPEPVTSDDVAVLRAIVEGTASDKTIPLAWLWRGFSFVTGPGT